MSRHLGTAHETHDSVCSHRWSLMLPNSDHRPAQRRENLAVVPATRNIRSELGLPELAVCLRQC